MRASQSVFIIICFTLILSLLSGSTILAEWAYPNWTLRREIVLDNSQNPNTLFGFQIKLIVPHYRGMQSDFDDLRFAKSDETGTPPLPYWIEEFVEDRHAVVYTKVPDIPANGMTRIYVYYGNLNAQGESNGKAVFDFFDDFNDRDISDWQILVGSWRAENEFLEQMLLGNHMKALSSYTVTFPAIIEAQMNYLSTYHYSGNHLLISKDSGVSSGYKFGYGGLNVGGTWIAKIVGGDTQHLVSDPTIWVGNYPYVWLKGKGTFDGTGNLRFHLKAPDGVQVHLNAYDASYTLPFILGNYVGAHSGIDDLRVRKYTDPEPSYTIGKEESNFPWHPDKEQPLLSLVSRPFSQPMQFCLNLSKDATISANLYDCSGRKISTIKDNIFVNQGSYIIAIDRNMHTFGSGPLFLHLTLVESTGKTYQLCEKILLIK